MAKDPGRQKMLFYLAAAFFVILAAYAIFSVSSGSKALTATEAAKFAVQDASATYAGETDLRVVSAVYSNSTGQWNVVLEAVKNAHSPCPSVDRLEYSMMPISSRPPKPVIFDCQTHPIFRAEQALVNSAKDSSISSFVAGGAQGCAFRLPLAINAEERAYCTFMDPAGIQSFASANNIADGNWVAQWTKDGQSKYAALDSAGKVLATG